MRSRGGFLLACWCVLLAAAQTAAFVAVWWFFVRTWRGQTLDTIALTGNSIGQDEAYGPASTVLGVVSVASLALATGVIGFIALIRGRVLLAVVATAVIGGSNLTTQLFKYGTARPALGVDPYDAYANNSLPSGHTTVAMSVAVALVLVLPAALRGVGALIGAAYAAAAGVATLSAGWHRPSDAVAAILVVGAWAAAGLLVLALARQQRPETNGHARHPTSLALLVVVGGALLAVAGLAMAVTDEVTTVPLELLSRRRLFVAYVGSAAAIAGTAGLTMALVLATARYAAPPRSVSDSGADPQATRSEEAGTVRD
ncbi:phosphatase PAP2 family protein [Micromonospora sp. NBC_01813]|uniref:phosphatase PAP2 family protein n=1 Tax=Micromonospora sp. NBC_01813 TaxID=2975988 RepID=UPI002DD97D57|nr:phosphatase PAP2 family protein [Micromonospora sp. NBC_01813]WSA09080.1 phosphatase PAP2 family protein [Micromonospora sp. NBC_01813]